MVKVHKSKEKSVLFNTPIRLKEHTGNLKISFVRKRKKTDPLCAARPRAMLEKKDNIVSEQWRKKIAAAVLT